MESTKVEPGRNLETYRILFIIKGVLNLLICLIGFMYVVMGFIFPTSGMTSNFPFNLFNLIFFIFGMALVHENGLGRRVRIDTKFVYIFLR